MPHIPRTTGPNMYGICAPFSSESNQALKRDLADDVRLHPVDACPGVLLVGLAPSEALRFPNEQYSTIFARLSAHALKASVAKPQLWVPKQTEEDLSTALHIIGDAKGSINDLSESLPGVSFRRGEGGLYRVTTVPDNIEGFRPSQQIPENPVVASLRLIPNREATRPPSSKEVVRRVEEVRELVDHNLRSLGSRSLSLSGWPSISYHD